MRPTLKRIWSALVAAYDSGWSLLVANLMWLVATVVAVGVAYLLTYAVDSLVTGADAAINILFYVLLVVTNAVPLAGLFYTAHQLAEGEYGGLRTFLKGIRLHTWTALRWLVLNALVIYALLFYIALDFGSRAVGTVVISVAGAALFWWVLVNLYALPLALYQSQPGILRSLRNALVIYAKLPGLAFGIILLIALVAGLSYILPPLVFVISLGLIAFLATFAVQRAMLILEGKETPEEDSKEKA